MFPRRGAIALVTTAIALVLLFNFKTPDEAASVTAVASTGGSSGGSSGNSSVSSRSTTSATVTPLATAGASSSPASSSGAVAATGSETLTGSMISSRYGNVEVRVTISKGSITAVDAIALPSGGRSGQISRYVEPVLSSEALTAQSANIDIVSGATYTSEAYAQSLQSALDQAAVSGNAAG